MNTRFALPHCLGLAMLVAGSMLPSTASATENLIAKASNHTVATTVERLNRIVVEKGFTVFTTVDHAAGAAKVGKTLRPTQLLIFGNPKVGTALLSSAQSVGLDLPIRVLAWEDAQGQVWIGYTPPATLASRHGISDRDQVVARMTGALDAITSAAAK